MGDKAEQTPIETVRMQLRVEECDPDSLRSIVKAASEGYHLVRWQGVAPADLVGPYAAARAAVDGADWDEDRVRALDQEAEQRGQTLLTVAALGLDAGGEEVVAGFSEILLTAGTTRALQSDTAVLKQHRGRGLGLWVKAAMLQWLLGAHPEVDQVETVCALTNQHMIAINAELGFRRESPGKP